MCLSISAKWLWHMTDASFPLKFTKHLERSYTNHYHQSNFVSDFKAARMCLTWTTILQCSLSAGKQKFTIILVYWRYMQVTKETWHLHKQCARLFFFPNPPIPKHTHKSLGMRLLILKLLKTLNMSDFLCALQREMEKCSQ